jgi:hypothetical protein
MRFSVFLELTLVFMFFLFLPVIVGAEEMIEPPPAGVLRQIFNNPKVVTAEVSKKTGNEDGPWISMYADVHVYTDISLENMDAVVTAYEDYPAFFTQVKNVQVRRSMEGVYQSFKVIVGLMGFSVESNYTVLVEEIVRTPSKLILKYSHVSDDGSIKDVHGTWYLESLSLDGKPGTYMRYTSTSRVIQKFPLQRIIMAMFAGSEHTQLIHRFLNSASR